MHYASAAVISLCTVSTQATAAVTTYYSPPNHAAARNNWMNDIGTFTTLDFTGFDNFTFITTQYSHLGVTFTDGVDQIRNMPGAFLNDDWGLHGAFDEIRVSFAQPIRAIACDFPGFLKLRLYSGDQLIFSSMDFIFGAYQFAGLISEQPFDSAVILDPSGDVYIDDLYFGPPIPAPGALAVLAAALLRGRPRRRPS